MQTRLKRLGLIAVKLILGLIVLYATTVAMFVLAFHPQVWPVAKNADVISNGVEVGHSIFRSPSGEFILFIDESRWGINGYRIVPTKSLVLLGTNVALRSPFGLLVKAPQDYMGVNIKHTGKTGIENPKVIKGPNFIEFTGRSQKLIRVQWPNENQSEN